MFSRQKTTTDVKKSTQKLLDSKKDVPTRLKHLKLILDFVDGAEAKALFCMHYSPIYHLVYEGIVSAETSLKNRGVHRAQREELDSVLHLLEKILILCPDLLQCRWQLHSLSRLMAKLNHPANSLKLRREAIRLFLIWYQCLGKSAPNYVHGMFSSLVPGLGDSQAWPPPSDPSWGITPLDITPVLPANPGEKQPDDLNSYLLECVLDYMISQAPKIHWKEGAQMWAKSIDFLYERFKEFYLPRIFPSFSIESDIYKPTLELPEPRKSADMSNSSIFTCQVVFVKWIANYAHSVYRSTDCYQPTNVWNNKTTAVHFHHDEKKLNSTPPSSLHSDRDSITSYSSIPSDVDANVLAKDVILGSRENINLLHEVFRRALLMNFVHSAAIRRVICVYKDWIQINVPELPVFMLEPEDFDSTDEASQPSSMDPPKNRLRTDSYYGAIGFNANNNREEYLSQLRAGAQKVLRVFFCNSAAVFLLFQTPKHEAALALLEEQVDVCKRVLNIYRYAVMNTRMDPKTWEQLLVVMLHITSTVLSQNQLHSGTRHPDTLGYKLSSALFQTLIVSWVKASLNVNISVELWDQLQSVLAQLTVSDELVTEWAKTMVTLTRVLSRHVYHLDLDNLPLERLTEQKAKKKRGLQSGTFTKETFKQVSGVPEGTTFPRKRHTSSGTSSERKSLVFSPSTTSPQKKTGLKRSQSEGNITSPGKSNKHKNTIISDKSESNSIQSPASRPGLFRKISRSADSIRKLNPKEVFVFPNPVLQPDWAEISSSTASLENTSNIQVDEDGTSVDGYGSAKAELSGVIAGGSAKGWLPSVAAILWRRMLGILGDVNNFSNPKTHAHFFQIITDMWITLFKVRRNQGVSIDNCSTPKPPELVPPLTLLAPWCIQALDLGDEFHRGKVLGCSLLCDMTLSNQDIKLDQEYLCKFYAALHRCIIANNQDIVNTIVKQCGTRFVPRMLPGFSLLVLDLIQAAHSVLSSDDLKSAPRMEASSLLGTLLTISSVFKDLKVLQPNSLQFQPIQTQHTKLVLSYLIQTAKVEQTSQARAIALQSLSVYLSEQLMEIRHAGYPPPNIGIPEADYNNRLCEIFLVLLEAVKVANRSVALVAADLMLLLADFAVEVSTYFPKLCTSIILGLKWSLQYALPLKNSTWAAGRPIEMEKRLYISLMLTLGEWCMRLPLEILLNSGSRDRNSLLSGVFEVLHMVIQGYQTPGESTSLTSSLVDFNSSIPFDDLQICDANRNQEKSAPVTTINSLAQDLQTVKLAARSLISHLLTQVGHFPITTGAARCSSIVSENDDLPYHGSDWGDELNSRIFALPNLQMFALDNETILTMIELPAQENSTENEVSGFQTSQTQVRVILRDLSGKASWDASYLVPASKNFGIDGAMTLLPLTNTHPDELYYQSAMTGSFFPQMGPRLTVRHRHPGHLPTVEDSADDLDNLDDLLGYIGHTSPECQLKVGESLTTPWGPPPTSTQDQEDEVVASVVNQRNTELEYLVKVDMDVTMRAKPLSLVNALGAGADPREFEGNMLSLEGASKSSPCSSSFLLSRRLFSQLGLNGWEKRSIIHLLNKDEKLLRELKHLDAQKCRESHKIAVIYVARGQEDKQSILFNTAGSEAYEDFVAGLGWEVELETHTGFMGGLHKNKNSGETAPYHATSFTEVIFHVATRLPSNTEESLLQKTRHLGNDEVHIVWSEHYRDYRRDIIPTEFCDVLIVIYPLEFGLYRVQVSRKPEVPYFGPLYNEAVVSGVILPSLVRATAINASRARRSSLQYFQHHFQERSKCLSGLIQMQKVRTTFEQFASNVFCPLLPTISFQSGIINRASGASFASTAKTSSTAYASHQLASALLDHSMSSSGSGSGGNLDPLPPRRMTTAGSGPTFRFSTSSPYENVNLNFSPNLVRSSQGQQLPYNQSESSSASAPVSPIPPVPPKRLSLKLGSGLSKPKLHTPPASPATSLRSTPGSHSK